MDKKEALREKRRLYSSKYYYENKAIVLAKMKIYVGKNKERTAQSQKEWAAKNKEQLAEKKRIYARENKEKLKEYKKQYYIKNRRKIIDKAQKKYFDNIEYKREYYKNFFQNNKERRSGANKNKGRRTELTKLKYKKRLSQLGLKHGEGKFFAYKSHGKPCSCFMCSHEKYKRSAVKVWTKEEVEALKTFSTSRIFY